MDICQELENKINELVPDAKNFNTCENFPEAKNYSSIEYLKKEILSVDYGCSSCCLSLFEDETIPDLYATKCGHV